MLLTIKHLTRYHFEEPVRFALQQLRKTPKSTAQQTVLEWKTSIVGGRKELSFEDHHRNVTELVSFGGDGVTLELHSEGRVEAQDAHGVVGRHRGPAPLWLFRKPTPRTRGGKGVKALVRDIDAANPLEALHSLSRKILAQVTYETGASQSDWTAEDAIKAGRGVCQDHTHIFIACAREMGAPARYVSGYLMLDNQTAQDAMHAWAEAFVEGLGWVGFDVSNGISPDARYVRVATGLDYAEAAPVSGARIGGAGETLQVQIEVAQQ